MAGVGKPPSTYSYTGAFGHHSITVGAILGTIGISRVISHEAGDSIEDKTAVMRLASARSPQESGRDRVCGPGKCPSQVLLGLTGSVSSTHLAAQSRVGLVPTLFHVAGV
jgi:hypothetical protein